MLHLSHTSTTFKACDGRARYARRTIFPKTRISETSSFSISESQRRDMTTIIRLNAKFTRPNTKGGVSHRSDAQPTYTCATSLDDWSLRLSRAGAVAQESHPPLFLSPPDTLPSIPRSTRRFNLSYSKQLLGQSGWRRTSCVEEKKKTFSCITAS